MRILTRIIIVALFVGLSSMIYEGFDVEPIKYLSAYFGGVGATACVFLFDGLWEGSDE